MSTAAAAPTPPAGDLCHHLLPAPRLNDLAPKAPQAAYTPWGVTWLLVSQRLYGTAALHDAVAEFLCRFPPQARPACQRVQPPRLSANSGAYSQARTHRAARVLYWAAENLSHSLIASYPCSWGDRRACRLDGTTIQLAPTPARRAAYPPARNQHGRSHWPIRHWVTAHELSSGLAVLPEQGPMYGPQARSELALAQGVLTRLPDPSILVADRNCGVCAFVGAAAQAQHDVRLRLSGPRFAALRKQARSVGAGAWEVVWRPSRWDRKSHPELPAAAQVKGRLHQVPVAGARTLGLFTTRSATGAPLAALYHKRQDVETDRPDLKETLGLGAMTSKSVAMVEKELAAALRAYNLANPVRRLAAARLPLPPRRLSIKGVWGLLRAFAQGRRGAKTRAEAEAEVERWLRAAGQRQLPRRAAGRSYPREVLPRRRKFPTRKRDQNDPPE